MDRLWVEYPIPYHVSIWGGDDIDSFPVADLTTLIAGCVQELASDVYVTDYINATGNITQLPNDAFAVVSARLSFEFQGNRVVKATFDPSTKRCMLRYYPAAITFRRTISVPYLDAVNMYGQPYVQGDSLIYIKAYILWKMAEKELQILKAVDLQADNGQVDLSVLSDFATTYRQRYEELKPAILIYATGN